MHLYYRTENVLLATFVMMTTPLYDHANLTFILFYCYFVVYEYTLREIKSKQ